MPLLLVVRVDSELASAWSVEWQELTMAGHLHIALKAVIVNTSWLFAYVALKHLPLSIVAPIRASGPVWTLLGAIILFAERPDLWQWIGLVTIIVSYFFFSLLGKKEGIQFSKNKWIWYIVLATMIGTISTLYDKYLIVNCGHRSIYLAGLVFCLFSYFDVAHSCCLVVASPSTTSLCLALVHSLDWYSISCC